LVDKVRHVEARCGVTKN